MKLCLHEIRRITIEALNDAAQAALHAVNPAQPHHSDFNAYQRTRRGFGFVFSGVLTAYLRYRPRGGAPVASHGVYIYIFFFFTSEVLGQGDAGALLPC